MSLTKWNKLGARDGFLAGSVGGGFNSQNRGGTETRPVNITVNTFIKIN